MAQLLLAVIYLAFISLGLPDALLGCAWPSMYLGFGVPLSYAGVLSIIVSVGTVISSLASDRLTRAFGAGRVTAASVAMTAAALLGFSVSGSLGALCFWCIPYGLGAGSVDAALNNYVALHYASRHMSWLHCMWGVGASVGPYIMGAALAAQGGWPAGYRSIAWLQIALTAVLLFSLPLWKDRCAAGAHAGTAEKTNGLAAAPEKPLTLRRLVRLRGAKESLVLFFCYCAVEQTAGLWASSYLVLRYGISADRAAGLASLFFVGITVGRIAGGFLTMRVNDAGMIRAGLVLLGVGIGVLALPLGFGGAAIGLLLIGLGCAPVYPCMIHSTPALFGKNASQAVIGAQMASAYVGICMMPPLFGLLAEHVTVALLPAYLLVIAALMAWMHERLRKKAARA